MYHVKNLTNSPYRIITADGGFGVLMARGEGEFEIHPNMLNSYKQLGFMQITKIDKPSSDYDDVDGAKYSEDATGAEAEAALAEMEESESELTEGEQKEALIAQLAELEIKADKRSSVETLQQKLDEAMAK